MRLLTERRSRKPAGEKDELFILCKVLCLWSLSKSWGRIKVQRGAFRDHVMPGVAAVGAWLKALPRIQRRDQPSTASESRIRGSSVEMTRDRFSSVEGFDYNFPCVLAPGKSESETEESNTSPLNQIRVLDCRSIWSRG